MSLHCPSPVGSGRSFDLSPIGVTWLAALNLLLSAGSLHAQAVRATSTVIEIGVDGGLVYDGETEITHISLPAQQLRVGVFVSPRLSFEPSIGFDRVSAKGGSISTLDASVGLLATVAGVATGAGRTTSVYVRPFGGLTRLSASSYGEGNSATQFQLGGGVGIRTPLVDRLGARFEAFYAHGFSANDVPSSNSVGLRVGLSFFTR